MKRKLAWLLRTGFGTIWLLSGLFFLCNIAAGLAEPDYQLAESLMVKAGYFGAIMIVAALAHAFLIIEYRKTLPPDTDYPDHDNLAL